MSQAEVVVDGGDTGCGELLMLLAKRIRTELPGTVVRLIATDPAAPADLPAWCRLTGHRYCGMLPGQQRPTYLIELTKKESA